MEKSICTVCSGEFTRSEYVYLGYVYCPNCALQSNAVRAIRCLIRKAGSAKQRQIDRCVRRPQGE